MVTASPKTRAWKRRTKAVAAPGSPAARPATSASSESDHIRFYEPRARRDCRRPIPRGALVRIDRRGNQPKAFEEASRGPQDLALLAASLVAIPLGLAACGDDDEETRPRRASETTTEETTTSADSAAVAARRSTISETEFALDPADPTAPAGAVTFDVANDGQTVHNLEVEGNGIEEVTADLEPRRQRRRSSVDLRAGDLRDVLRDRRPRGPGHGGELTVE